MYNANLCSVVYCAVYQIGWENPASVCTNVHRATYVLDRQGDAYQCVYTVSMHNATTLGTLGEMY